MKIWKTLPIFLSRIFVTVAFLFMLLVIIMIPLAIYSMYDAPDVSQATLDSVCVQLYGDNFTFVDGDGLVNQKFVCSKSVEVKEIG